MAKIKMRWKDPDYCDDWDGLFAAYGVKEKPMSERQRPWDKWDREDSQRAYRAVHAAGLGEYLVVELDTETGIAKILRDDE